MNASRKRDLRLASLALALMAVFACLHLLAPDVSWLRRMELAAFDAQVRWRGPERPGPEIVIAMVDDRTVAEAGQWPLPRHRLAELVTRLHRAGAKVIGIDILFADATAGDGDAALAKALRDAGSVVLPFTFEFAGMRRDAPAAVVPTAYAHLRHSAAYRPLALQPTSVIAPIAALAENAALGHMLVAYDVDGAPRYEYPALAFDLDHYPSMAMRVAQHYLGVAPEDTRVDLGRGIALGAVRVPTDASMRMLVRYLGPSRAFPTYPVAQVLRGEVADAVFRDRIVLVGADALGSRDTFRSPFTSVLPGVERLATIVDSVLHERHIVRPTSAPLIEVASMLAVALALGLAVARWPLVGAAAFGVALATAYAVSAQILLRHGIWQASAPPALAVFATFVGLSLYRYGLLDRERRHMRRLFGRYLAPAMVDRLVDDPELPRLGGELRELTILFCDLQGFTALSERLEPTTLTRVLNQFLSAATDAVLEHGGTVDKYVGDCIMAFWNAPIEQPNHAELACRAALRIVANLEALNAAWAREGGLPHLGAGVGINTGPCTLGNFGSTHRFDYSAIGDAVNVAARLESETRVVKFPILLGPATAARVPHFATLPLGLVRVKGRVQGLEIHALIGDETIRDSASFRERHAAHVRSRLDVADGQAQRA